LHVDQGWVLEEVNGVQAVFLRDQRVKLQNDDEGNQENTCNSPKSDDGSRSKGIDDAPEGKNDSQASGTGKEDDGIDPVHQAELLQQSLGGMRVNAGEEEEIDWCKCCADRKVDVESLEPSYCLPGEIGTLKIPISTWHC
jgi:hypothetical protein